MVCTAHATSAAASTVTSLDFGDIKWTTSTRCCLCMSRLEQIQCEYATVAYAFVSYAHSANSSERLAAVTIVCSHFVRAVVDNALIGIIGEVLWLSKRIINRHSTLADCGCLSSKAVGLPNREQHQCVWSAEIIILLRCECSYSSGWCDARYERRSHPHVTYHMQRTIRISDQVDPLDFAYELCISDAFSVERIRFAWNTRKQYWRQTIWLRTVYLSTVTASCAIVCLAIPNCLCKSRYTNLWRNCAQIVASQFMKILIVFSPSMLQMCTIFEHQYNSIGTPAQNYDTV